MLTGIGFLAVVTASVTASLVESSRRRFAAQSESDDATASSTEIGATTGEDRSGTRPAAPRGLPMPAADEAGSIASGMSDEQPESTPAPASEPAPTEPYQTSVLRVA